MAKSQELAMPELDYFAQYGQAAGGSSNIVGKLLRFTKGEYVAGKEAIEVPMGTRIVVNMDSVLTGWVHWEAQRPIEQLMGEICKGFQPAKRTELGDNDPKDWEPGPDGTPRDPWQFANQFLCRGVGKDKNELYTFTTNSKGGFGAVGALCTVYSEVARQKPGKYPVIELGVDSYNHPVKAYGKIKVPVFEVVDWTDKSLFDEQEKTSPRKRISRK